MPIKNVNYENTVIYKIVCNDLTITDLYVGNTTNFTKRKGQHKYNCINEKSKSYNFKIYKAIRESGGWENWTMIEIEKYPCNDGNEARSRERHYYEVLKCNLNIQIPMRTQSEYYQNNKQKIIDKTHQYAEENKQKLKERKIKYRDTNNETIKAHKSKICLCECGLNYTHHHLQRHLRSKIHANRMAQKEVV
jgi:hypothetical protein